MDVPPPPADHLDRGVGHHDHVGDRHYGYLRLRLIARRSPLRLDDHHRAEALTPVIPGLAGASLKAGGADAVLGLGLRETVEHELLNEATV